MLPEEFSPVETPELTLAIDYAHKTRNLEGELLCALLSAKSDLAKYKRALRNATGSFAASERAHLREMIRTTESMITKLTQLHGQADQIANHAWEKRAAIINAQYEVWAANNPEIVRIAENRAFKAYVDMCNHARQDRRTTTAALRRRAATA